MEQSSGPRTTTRRRRQRCSQAVGSISRRFDTFGLAYAGPTTPFITAGERNKRTTHAPTTQPPSPKHPSLLLLSLSSLFYPDALLFTLSLFLYSGYSVEMNSDSYCPLRVRGCEYKCASSCTFSTQPCSLPSAARTPFPRVRRP